MKDALNFLMTREVAHQKSFEKALYAMEPNFPAGKLVGLPAFADKYYNMSQGEGDVRGPWNEGEQWEFIDDREQQGAVDGGDGSTSVSLGELHTTAVQAFAARTVFDPDNNPVTGADLGAGPGAGTTTELIEDGVSVNSCKCATRGKCGRMGHARSSDTVRRDLAMSRAARGNPFVVAGVRYAFLRQSQSRAAPWRDHCRYVGRTLLSGRRDRCRSRRLSSSR